MDPEELRRRALLEAFPWMDESTPEGFERVPPGDIAARGQAAEARRREGLTAVERISEDASELGSAARDAGLELISGVGGAWGGGEGVMPTAAAGLAAAGAAIPGGESPSEAFQRVRDFGRSELARIHEMRQRQPAGAIPEDVPIVGGLTPLQATGAATGGALVKGIGAGITEGMPALERTARTAAASGANAGIAGVLTGAAESRGDNTWDVLADAARQGLYGIAGGAAFGGGSELLGSAAGWLGRKMGVLDPHAPLFRRLESLGFTRGEINNMTDEEAADLVQRAQSLGMARGPTATVHSNFDVAEREFPRAAEDYSRIVSEVSDTPQARIAQLRQEADPLIRARRGFVENDDTMPLRRTGQLAGDVAGPADATQSPPRRTRQLTEEQRRVRAAREERETRSARQDMDAFRQPSPVTDEMHPGAAALFRDIEGVVGPPPDTDIPNLASWFRETAPLRAMATETRQAGMDAANAPRPPRVMGREDILGQPAAVRGDPRRVTLGERIQQSSGPGTTEAERQLARGAEEALQVVESRRHYPEGVRMQDLPEVRSRIDASRAGSRVLTNAGEGFDLVDAALAREMKGRLDRYGQQIGDPELGGRFRDAASRYRTMSQVQPALDRARREGRPMGTRLEATVAGGGATTGAVTGAGLHTILRSFDPSIRASVMEFMQREPNFRRWAQEKGPAAVMMLAHVLGGGGQAPAGAGQPAEAPPAPEEQEFMEALGGGMETGQPDDISDDEFLRLLSGEDAP